MPIIHTLDRNYDKPSPWCHELLNEMVRDDNDQDVWILLPYQYRDKDIMFDLGDFTCIGGTFSEASKEEVVKDFLKEKFGRDINYI